MSLKLTFVFKMQFDYSTYIPAPQPYGPCVGPLYGLSVIVCLPGCLPGWLYSMPVCLTYLTSLTDNLLVYFITCWNSTQPLLTWREIYIPDPNSSCKFSSPVEKCSRFAFLTQPLLLVELVDLGLLLVRVLPVVLHDEVNKFLRQLYQKARAFNKQKILYFVWKRSNYFEQFAKKWC